MSRNYGCLWFSLWPSTLRPCWNAETGRKCGGAWIAGLVLMKMPNAERAVVDVRKLRDYCLSVEHPRCRHKARVFEAILGYTAAHAEELRDVLLAAAQSDQAVAGEHDDFGRRYLVDVVVSGPAGEATVRSTWIVRQGEDFPRLTSCYVV